MRPAESREARSVRMVCPDRPAQLGSSARIGDSPVNPVIFNNVVFTVVKSSHKNNCTQSENKCTVGTRKAEMAADEKQQLNTKMRQFFQGRRPYTGGR